MVASSSLAPSAIFFPSDPFFLSSWPSEQNLNFSLESPPEKVLRQRRVGPSRHIQPTLSVSFERFGLIFRVFRVFCAKKNSTVPCPAEKIGFCLSARPPAEKIGFCPVSVVEWSKTHDSRSCPQGRGFESHR